MIRFALPYNCSRMLFCFACNSESFLEGEQEFGDKSLWIMFEEFIVKYTCTLYSISNETYDLILPEAYIDMASRLLFLECKSKYCSIFNVIGLLENGADPNYCATDDREMLDLSNTLHIVFKKFHNLFYQQYSITTRTPLHYCARKGRYLCFLYIARAGADINRVNTLLQSPLMLAWCLLDITK